MFYYCNNLTKINFGKLDFSLRNSFEYMLSNYKKIVDLDVTNFNTKNRKSFRGMFYNMNNL